jgi:adenine/guanine phosphoribosyltransferase-like PRPP-binding protein
MPSGDTVRGGEVHNLLESQTGLKQLEAWRLDRTSRVCPYRGEAGRPGAWLSAPHRTNSARLTPARAESTDVKSDSQEIPDMLYHGSGSLSDLNGYVRKTVETLKPFKRRFDSIVVTGMSGVILGSPVALRLHKPLVVLRKEVDNDNHSYTKWINLENAGARYIILDDFIASGRTFHRMREYANYEGITYVGAYMYGDDILSWDGDGNIEWHPERKDDGRCWGIATQRSKHTVAPVKATGDVGGPVNGDVTYGTAAEFLATTPYPVTGKFVCDEDGSLAWLKALLCGEPGEAEKVVAETAPPTLDSSHYTARLADRVKAMSHGEHKPEDYEAPTPLLDWAERQVAAYRRTYRQIDAGEMWRQVEAERERKAARHRCAHGEDCRCCGWLNPDWFNEIKTSDAPDANETA